MSNFIPHIGKENYKNFYETYVDPLHIQQTFETSSGYQFTINHPIPCNPENLLKSNKIEFNFKDPNSSEIESYTYTFGKETQTRIQR